MQFQRFRRIGLAPIFVGKRIVERRDDIDYPRWNRNARKLDLSRF
jgi:hypothetical protein